MQNLVIIAGNVGAAAETRTTQGGTKITQFSLATSRPKRDSEGKILKDDGGRRVEDTEWHRITCFNGVGKTVAQYVDKGQRQLRADGSIREEDAYRGIADAFSTIYGKEGGLFAFFAGLGSDLAKSAADSIGE